MRSQAPRLSVLGDGRLEIADPDLGCLPLLKSLDPLFEIRQAPLARFSGPRCVRAKFLGTGLEIDSLPDLTEEDLWALHEEQLAILGTNETIRRAPGEASVLDLKTELGLRVLRRCRLCARLCGADRGRGAGPCRLGRHGIVAEHFVHIGEEPPINPSLVLSLAGCSLRCRHCQQAWLLEPAEVAGEALDESLWERLDLTGARSMSFVGGNPSESLPAALSFLSGVPDGWHLPIVWNCHGYESAETLALLRGVVDVYLPDFKYGNDRCAEELSIVPGYVETAAKAVAEMLQQGVPVIVRILVLPGHVECCHRPAIDRLAHMMGRENVFLSVRGQYSPDHLITGRDADLARRPTAEECARVREHAEALGLTLIA
ncbi:MAG: radical SAM protein [Deltaproteobacteria bacterium]|nr:radical SAM protein [Deltaproteobacteria bacterium]